MPPKVKFTKDEIIEAALDITRTKGIEGLTARALAERLGSSAKPIFGLFESMEEVKQEVFCAGNTLYMSYITQDMKGNTYPPYKASGMAYIRFAKEETELFKLLFMRDRSNEVIGESREDIRPMLKLLQKNLGIDEDMAFLFHLKMWIYVHGIATMIATSYLDWDIEFISNTLTDVYLGLKSQYSQM